MPAQALYCRRKFLHLIIDRSIYYTFMCVNVVRQLQLAQGTPLMLGYLCDNIGLVLACLPSGMTGVTGSPSRYMTQPFRIPILSPLLFMHIGDPYIPLFKFEEFLIYLSRLLFYSLIETCVYSKLSIYTGIYLLS